ncbi:MAG: DUF1858 domain-containing protein [Gemmataceae bacterium]
MATATTAIAGEVLIPDLLRAAPQVRPVLDQYGLKGCGGPLGPVETLEFFARAHDVPLPRLLSELEAAAETARPAPVVKTAAADRIYRPFFLAGIAVVLTLGAVWGAYLLLRIGFTGAFRSAGLHEVNAHGHAQIFGWVGLFVMGFAYQAFPRFKHTRLAWPGLAFATLALMLGGIVVRSVGEPLAETVPLAAPVSVLASIVEVAAIVLFVAVMLATWRRAGWKLATYDAYILASFGWFVAQAVGETLYLAATLYAPDRTTLLALVAIWQGALREAQIHGFALLIILGVSQRIFHHFYGLPEPTRRTSVVALGLLHAAIVGEILGLILQRTAGHAWAGLWYAGVLLLSATVAVLVHDWGIFRQPQERDRNLKFLRAAYVWLLISLGMAVLLPVYQFVVLPALAPTSEAVTLGFSHAYYGAIRHAITVGFVSLMIVGVAGKVVPTLNGVDVHRLGGLWAPFLLINAGCALRVTGQTLTDFTATAFPFAGVSGLLEVTGLALWSAHLVAVMAGRVRLQPEQADHQPFAAGARIEATHRVGELLDAHPELLDTFVGLGFQPLRNPVLRRTVARQVTVGRACRLAGVPLDAALAALNRGRKPGKVSLPMLG